ncbi:MAG: hypothetical protein AAFP69_24285 [Planctomycetota bacterium]
MPSSNDMSVMQQQRESMWLSKEGERAGGCHSIPTCGSANTWPRP